MKEKVLFTMPQEPEEFIAAIVIVEAYERTCELEVQTAIKQKRSINPPFECEIYLNGVEDKFKFLVKSTYKTTIPEEPTRWALEYIFDAKKAKSLARATKKHITEAFGIQLGIEPGSIFPSLVKQTPSEKLVVLIRDEDWDKWDELTNILEVNMTGYEIQPVGGLDKFVDVMKLIEKSSIVIGRRSAVTYLACAMKKKVIEWWPKTRNNNWLTKWENPNYKPIFLDKPLTASYVYRLAVTDID